MVLVDRSDKGIICVAAEMSDALKWRRLRSKMGDSFTPEVGPEETFAILRGSLMVKNGEMTEGMSLLRSGATAYRAIGQEAWMPYFTALVAGACAIAGQIDEGLPLLDEALQIVERTGERWFEAELRRHKGRLLLQQGMPRPLRNCIARRSTSPANRKRNSGNCAPPSALPSSGEARAAAAKPATSSPRSTGGSPRALTHQT